MNPIIKKLKNSKLNADELAICRLGQHSFLIKIANKLIAFDPYLSENKSRLIPPLITKSVMAHPCKKEL